MKLILPVIAVLFFAACEQKTPPPPAPASTPEVKTMQAPAADSSLVNVKTEKYDPICGMPVTAGIVDTATYDKKTYGFCSPDCKAEFVKDPKAAIASSR